MYGLKELKRTIEIDKNTVECPIKNCVNKVKRQKISFKKEKEFQCPTHKIYLSPSTFEYETEYENLLWTDSSDRKLFDEIKKVKRESRIARDNSEDALTWNVMRFLDKQGLLPDFLTKISKNKINKAELILWSYSPKENSSWTLLNNARLEFGETVERGSEPDIIILTDKVLYFIEAKLTAKNRTIPSNLKNKKRYETGGGQIFKEIFKSDYDTVSMKEKRYELMRFWLLGSWIAKQIGLDFEFYSLVMQTREPKLKTEFGKHIIETSDREFKRITWEQIYDYVKSRNITNEDKKMIEYLENKTIGYGSNREIIKAFQR